MWVWHCSKMIKNCNSTLHFSALFNSTFVCLCNCNRLNGLVILITTSIVPRTIHTRMLWYLMFDVFRPVSQLGVFAENFSVALSQYIFVDSCCEAHLRIENVPEIHNLYCAKVARHVFTPDTWSSQEWILPYLSILSILPPPLMLAALSVTIQCLNLNGTPQNPHTIVVIFDVLYVSSCHENWHFG